MLTGCQGEAAVAHDHTGDTVVTRARANGIPKHLSVHVGVPIHKTRRYHMAFGVDGLLGPVIDAPDGGDLTVLHRHIRPILGVTRTIDNAAVLDH